MQHVSDGGGDITFQLATTATANTIYKDMMLLTTTNRMPEACQLHDLSCTDLAYPLSTPLQSQCSTITEHVTGIIMVALCNRADHCIFILWFSFFFSSPNLSGRRLDVYHTPKHGVALV